MQDAGSALMGIGRASGEDRAVEAAKAAINSPLLEISIDGARGVLFNVSGGSDLTMNEINEAAKIITESIDSEAKVIFGAVMDDKLKKGELKITVIATNFEDGLKKTSEPRIQDISRVNRLKQREAGENKPTLEAKTIITEEEQGSEWDIPAFIRRKIK